MKGARRITKSYIVPNVQGKELANIKVTRKMPEIDQWYVGAPKSYK